MEKYESLRCKNNGIFENMYKNSTDEELILQLRSGKSQIADYFMEKYKNLVRKKAKAMFLIGGENDDLIQEGMIGLFKAIRDYDEQKDAKFFSFAELCISRQMYSAVQASNRQKHIPLNTYVSLYGSASGESDEEIPLMEVLQSITDKNPEELLIDKENVANIEKLIDKNLSKLEKEVLELRLTGLSYSQIAILLEKQPKAIDNALQRMKTKLAGILRKS